MEPNTQQNTNTSASGSDVVVNPQLIQDTPQVPSTPPPPPQPPTQQQPPLAPPSPPLAQPGAQNQNPHLEQAAMTNPNSTQNTLLISEIRDGIVIMNDGSYRSVVMARSINFDLMSPEEREAVEYSYQGFLNSLYFPIQIFIRSQKIDMRPYLQKLDKLRTEHENMLLALLMADYINYIALLAQETNIMDKKFYVVIPYYPTLNLDKPVEAVKQAGNSLKDLIKPKKEAIVTINESDLGKAKQELKNRTQSAVNGLIQSGIQSIPLDTQELIELYYDVYNPDTATRQQIKNISDVSSPVITKGAGQPPASGGV